MSDLVTVSLHAQVQFGQLDVLRLRFADIDAVLVDAETVAMDWLIAPAVGFAKVQVRAEDEARAREVLAGTPNAAS